MENRHVSHICHGIGAVFLKVQSAQKADFRA